jgi:SAM-dependent methyltransferase
MSKTLVQGILERVLGHPRMYLALQRLLGSDRLRKLCIEKLNAAQGERILDLGCGPAYVIDYLPAVDYVGFDTSARYIEYAKRHYAGKGTFYCEMFSRQHVERLGFFDGVLALGLIHHISPDQGLEFLRLVARVLRPGGRVILLDPCLVPGETWMARFLARHDRGRFVTDEAGYRRIAQQCFREVSTTIVRNSGRLPSTEIIMILSVPIANESEACSG